MMKNLGKFREKSSIRVFGAKKKTNEYRFRKKDEKKNLSTIGLEKKTYEYPSRKRKKRNLRIFASKKNLTNIRLEKKKTYELYS